MKTLKIKSMIKTVTLVGLTLALLSCGKQGSSGNANGNVWQNCVGCSNVVNGTTFFTSISTDVYNTMQLTLNFIGNTYQNYNGYYGSASPIISYTGPVVATGTLQVNQSYATALGCVIPAGTYQLQTIQPGQWSQAIVSGLTLQAVSGNAAVMVQIPQAQVSAKSQLGQTWSEVAPVGSLFAKVNIQLASGYSCQVSTLFR